MWKQWTYSLYANRLEVDYRSWGGDEWHVSYELASLSPNYSRGRIRMPAFWSGLQVMALLAAAGAALRGLSYASLGGDFWSLGPRDTPVTMLLALVFLIAMVISVLNARLVSVVAFQYLNGEPAVSLDDGRWMRVEWFEELVRRVADGIRAHSAAKGPTPTIS